MRRGMRCDVLAGSHGGRQPSAEGSHGFALDAIAALHTSTRAFLHTSEFAAIADARGANSSLALALSRVN